MAEIYFVIGVSGSGKTTIGQLLSKEKNMPYFDADDFHTVENKVKMKAGTPLTDEDRIGWLDALNELACKQSQAKGAVIACSALKEKYRIHLSKNISSRVYWIVLKGDFKVLHHRMELRKDHYMPPGLLNSQLETMEYPPYGIHVNVNQTPDEILHQILQLQELSEFGIIGLGVMGKSLARNLGSKKIQLSLYNQSIAGKEEQVAEKAIRNYSELHTAKGFDDIPSFVQSIAAPRKILLMVPAGDIVDQVIHQLVPHLLPGDMIMDGGNSHFNDTKRRQKELITQGLHFFGIGVSGGEQGALHGPAIMPGGDIMTYASIEPFLNAIAARDQNGRPCCGFIGTGGAGHFVKMIHNGIEYAEMQLLSEVYWILKKGFSKSNEDIVAILESWQKQDLSSYLLEITIKVLQHKTGDHYTIDLIADIGASKGTGGWSLTAAADLGIPATMISEALFARYISSFKAIRILLDRQINARLEPLILDFEALKPAYTLARWINHHQGFEILHAASEHYHWNLNLAETARIWTNGCIIRSEMMETIAQVLKDQHHLLLTQVPKINTCKNDLIDSVTASLRAGLAIPCMSAALNYLLAYSSADSPTHLIQAQRDFFGAHTYRKADDPFGKSYHTEWE